MWLEQDMEARTSLQLYSTIKKMQLFAIGHAAILIMLWSVMQH